MFGEMEDMADVAEGLVADLISKGVDRIASRKKLTSQDLSVLLLVEQSRSLSRMEKGVERMEKGVEGIVSEMRGLRQELVPLLNQARDIADIRTRMERIEAKLA